MAADVGAPEADPPDVSPEATPAVVTVDVVAPPSDTGPSCLAQGDDCTPGLTPCCGAVVGMTGPQWITFGDGGERYRCTVCIPSGLPYVPGYACCGVQRFTDAGIICS